MYRGRAVSPGTRFGEVVFNTSMTGYQEILTDPSYRAQIVVMTQPHIGNYGIEARADESNRPWLEGFVARRFTRDSGRSDRGDLVGWLRRHRVPAIDGLDTRALVRRLRDKGAQRGVLTSERQDVDRLREELASFPSMTGRALVGEVTCERAYEVPAVGEERCHLAVWDFGAKGNILRSLAARGARITVLPARASSSQCRELGVDGVVLSNGPGDPEPLVEIQQTVREIVATGLPVLGICLGHQLLALALGAKTFKMPFGHHGGNHPVQDLETGKVSITSQNHGFAVDKESLPEGCRATEVNLNDGTVEAFEVAGRPVFSVQYHPEAAPGPHDAAAVFDRFLASLDT